MKYAFLCGILLAGCGGPMATGTAAPTATSFADTSPAAKPQLSNRQLGISYLTAAQPFNEYTCRFLKRHGTSTDVTIWMSFAQIYAGHLRGFADRLQAIDWNRKTRDEARRMTDALTAAEAAYREAAAKVYDRVFWRALERTDSFDASVSQAAGELRAALGLKPVRSCI
jgi:hypothetical protein